MLSEEWINIFKRVCLEPKTFASIVNSSLFAAFMAVLHAREQCQEQKPTPEVQLHRMLNKINVNVDPLKSWKTNTWPTDNRYACASVAFGMNLVTNGGFKKGIGATHLFFLFKVGLAKRESYTKTKPMEQDLGALRGYNLLRTNKHPRNGVYCLLYLTSNYDVFVLTP